MAETLKAFNRRKASGFFEFYIHGRGVDIGCGNDPLTPDCDTFEKGRPDNGIPSTSGMGFKGNAHYLEGCDPLGYDWVYSSHVLEHMENPAFAIRRWWRLVKPGGVLIVAVPHRDLYEKRSELPSRWNADHKWFWLPETGDDDSFVTIGLREFVEQSLPDADILSLEICDEGHTITDPFMHSNGEYQIECVMRKK